MHIGFQLLQPLLLLDAEMLLLVDNHEAEMLEMNILREQRMRADNNVELALGQLGFRLLRFLRADEPRELRDAHRQTGEALRKAAEMLPRQ